MSIHRFREDLTNFFNVKSITFCALELVHQVGGTTFIKQGDRIGHVGISASE